MQLPWGAIWVMLLPLSSGAMAAASPNTNQASGASLATCLAASGVAAVLPSSPAYVEASHLWNKRFDGTTPAAVAYASAASQVAAAIQCAQEAGIKAVPRCGGHSYEGFSTLDGQLTIDLSQMNQTQLSADKKQAVVQGGSTLGQLYYAVWQQAGNTTAAVGGTCPSVGVGGHILGGGIGMLSRGYGLACDQLLALRMVTWDGRLVTADHSQNTDLLWASCGGGGGNFGIVVEFTLRVVSVPDPLTTLTFSLSKEHALPFLSFWQQWVQGLDPRLTPVVNPTADGASVSAQFLGSETELRSVLAASGLTSNKLFSVRDLRLQEMPWVEAVIFFSGYDGVTTSAAQLADPSAMQAHRPYFKLKSYFAMDPLPEAALQVMLDWVNQTAELGTYIEIDAAGAKGAVAQVAPNATAYVHRSALYSIQYGGEWQDNTQTPKALAAIDKLQQQLAPFFPSPAAYINYLDEQQPQPMQAYYGENLKRLTQVKAEFDPDNFFSNPLTIQPANLTAMSPAVAPAPAAATVSAHPSAGPALEPSPAPVRPEAPVVVLPTKPSIQGSAGINASVSVTSGAVGLASLRTSTVGMIAALLLLLLLRNAA